MKKYEILRDTRLNNLEAAVQIYLRNGWLLHGRPFEFGGLICQAMVK